MSAVTETLSWNSRWRGSQRVGCLKAVCRKHAPPHGPFVKNKIKNFSLFFAKNVQFSDFQCFGTADCSAD